MLRPKLILMDFDGTIVDSKDALVRLTMNTLDEFNTVKDAELAHELIGIPTKERFTRHGIATEHLNAATDVFDKLHKTDAYSDVATIKGLVPWLEQYRNVPKWVITNSPRFPVEQSLRSLNIFDFFEKIITREDLNGQSKLEYFRKLPSLSKFWPKWFLGDEHNDLQAGSYIGAVTFLMNNSRNSHLQPFADFNIDNYNTFLSKEVNTAPLDDRYSKSVIECLSNLNFNSIVNISKRLVDAVKSGKSAYFAANGGSLAVARHFAVDLRKTVLTSGYQLNLHVLGIEAETLTAFSNDNSWDVALSLEMGVSIKKGDLVVILSTSGNSSNLVASMDRAKEEGGTVIKMTPPNLLLNTPVVSAPLFEDVLSVSLHMIVTLVRKMLIAPN